MMYDRIFTLTSGRTGTSWLASFLQLNLGHPTVHEALAPRDFGMNTPDVGLMREFNNYGNTARIKDFWAQKFDRLPKDRVHVETNHQFGKCGLIEHLGSRSDGGRAAVLVVRRYRTKIVRSFAAKGSFAAVGNMWLFLMHPKQAIRLVDPSALVKSGKVGEMFWYAIEMEARMAYYKRVFGDRVTFIDVDFDTMVTQEGAQALWSSLGGEGPCSLPPRKNGTTTQLDPVVKQTIEAFGARINVNVDAIVDGHLAQGFSFDKTRTAEPELVP